MREIRKIAQNSRIWSGSLNFAKLHWRRVYLDEVDEHAQARVHHRRVLVAQRTAHLVVEVRDRLGIDLVEAVQRHHRLLAHELHLVAEQLDDLARGRWDVDTIQFDCIPPPARVTLERATPRALNVGARGPPWVPWFERLLGRIPRR